MAVSYKRGTPVGGGRDDLGRQGRRETMPKNDNVGVEISALNVGVIVVLACKCENRANLARGAGGTGGTGVPRLEFHPTVGS